MTQLRAEHLSKAYKKRKVVKDVSWPHWFAEKLQNLSYQTINNELLINRFPHDGIDKPPRQLLRPAVEAEPVYRNRCPAKQE